jgi:preprotein translocase subunit Sss1
MTNRVATGSRRQWRPVFVLLVSLLVLLIMAFITVVWRQATSEGREELLRSLAQVGAQFIVVGLVGFFVKEYVDSRREEQRRAEAELDADRRRQDALDAFRLDVLRRVVGIANKVRRASVVLDAERSAEAYAEQMRSLADSYLELRLVIHEVPGATVDPNPIFPDWPIIWHQLKKMRDYLHACVREFRQENPQLQRLEAGKNVDSRDEIWQRISSLPRVSELLVEDPRPLDGAPTRLWSEFFGPYEDAMFFIRRAILRGKA